MKKKKSSSIFKPTAKLHKLLNTGFSNIYKISLMVLREKGKGLVILPLQEWCSTDRDFQFGKFGMFFFPFSLCHMVKVNKSNFLDLEWGRMRSGSVMWDLPKNLYYIALNDYNIYNRIIKSIQEQVHIKRTEINPAWKPGTKSNLDLAPYNIRAYSAWAKN